MSAADCHYIFFYLITLPIASLHLPLPPSLSFFPGTTSLFLAAKSVSGHPRRDDEGGKQQEEKTKEDGSICHGGRRTELCCIDGPWGGDNLACKEMWA